MRPPEVLDRGPSLPAQRLNGALSGFLVDTCSRRGVTNSDTGKDLTHRLKNSLIVTVHGNGNGSRARSRRRLSNPEDKALQTCANGRGRLVFQLTPADATSALVHDQASTGHFCPVLELDEDEVDVKTFPDRNRWLRVETSRSPSSYLPKDASRAPLEICIVDVLLGDGDPLKLPGANECHALMAGGPA